jgi:hypothetical protein
MACVLKKPIDDTKGILVITDGEMKDLLENSATLQEAIGSLRANWIIVVHCNSAHQQKIHPNPLVDAYIAGPGDIISVPGFSPYQIPMDCSNFCPGYFAPDQRVPKFWDVLFISRNKSFKSPEMLFRVVREIFDDAPLRVLAIIAHERAEDATARKSEPVRLYTSMFSAQERKFFTLLTPTVDYPFPFDLPSIANFYHQSKVFLHTAEEERHPRVVGYAWAAGLPVVAPISAASLLPESLRKQPGLFTFDDAKNAATAVRLAAENRYPLPAAYSEFHLAEFQISRFKNEIQALYAHLGTDFTDKGWFLNNLDLRLARHHVHNAGTNAAHASLLQLARQLRQPFPPEIAGDAELALDAYALLQPDDHRVAREAAIGQGLRPLRRFSEACRQKGLFSALRLALRHIQKKAV